MTDALRNLALSILSGVDALEAAYSKAGISLPSLDDSFVPSPLDKDGAVRDAQRLVASAASQIIAHARQPMESLQEYAMGMYMTATLGFVVDANIPDILKGAGQQGLHVADIAAQAGVDEEKLARVLRYLAARHVFMEVSPNIFANNRLSSVLMKAKTLEEIKANPLSKFEGAGAAAFIGHVADEGLKSSTAIASFLIDPKGFPCPFNMAMDFPSTMWDWYTKPENVYCGVRFAEAMQGTLDRYPEVIFTTALDWAALKDDEVAVDVGGGTGNLTLLLAKAFPHLKYVVQDLKEVIPEAEKLWAAEYPGSIANGRVALQVHDIFKPQPIKAAAVYYMRFILHDWNTSKSIEILKNIRAAASPSSKLVVWDLLVPNACRTIDHTRGTPLLPLGIDWVTSIDMQMMNLLNAQERTLPEFVQLGKAAGWVFEEKKFGHPLVAVVYSAA